MIEWDKIPKLTYVSSSPNHMDLKYMHEVLDHWAGDYGLNLNPDFQRGHVWTEKQQIKFIEYILRGGNTPPLLFNSPDYGGHRTKKSDLGKEIVIVDGLQRLTACQKFVAGDLKVFGNYTVNQFTDKNAMLRRTHITYVDYTVNQFTDKNAMLRRTHITYVVNHLQTRKEVLTWYLEMNEGHIAHSSEELERIRGLIKIN